MLEWIMQPWPWWFSGILVGLTVPLLFIMSGQAFGISTSFSADRRLSDRIRDAIRRQISRHVGIG